MRASLGHGPFGDAVDCPPPPRSADDIAALDTMVASTTALACRDDPEKMFNSLAGLLDQFCPHEIIVTLLKRDARFVQMLAEGTRQSADDVLVGDLRRRRGDFLADELAAMVAVMADEKDAAEYFSERGEGP